MSKKVYVMGSLRNPRIPAIGNAIRALGFEVFDDWFAGGYEADDKWMAYEKERGRHYGEALYGEAAKNIFRLDLEHLKSSDIGVLVLPAGKSGHLEIGWMGGQGKTTFALFDGEPERWDVMYQFLTGVAFSEDDLYKLLEEQR